MIWVILICGVRSPNHINLLFKFYIEKGIVNVNLLHVPPLHQGKINYVNCEGLDHRNVNVHVILVDVVTLFNTIDAL
jgi:hypothetical protein